jgi:RNA polymerase sigma factor (sigma-70 family)
VTEQTDSHLLRTYAERKLEPAFAELVRRHVDLVYSAAIRMVRDPHLAEDVTQSVFIALARQAPDLLDRPTLAGWLHRTTQNIAAQTVRTIERRRVREQEAVAMNEILSAEPDASWEQIAPHLDIALGELNEADRDAVLLRYFEKKSAQEIADVLGINAEAAQKRVNRAVERLREIFSKRKITIGAGGLVVLISANAVQSAPAGLAVAISSAALAGTAVTTSTLIATTKTFAMTTLQKTLITATIAVVAGAGIYGARQSSKLRARVQELEQQQTRSATDETAVAALQNKVDQLIGQNAELSNALAQANADKVRLAAEREQAKRGAALYKDLAEQASSKDMNPTNEYPTPRHVWAAFGRFGRLAALSREDQSKLSPEEKSALDAAKLKALEEIPNVVKAAKEYSDAKSMDTDSMAGKVDMMTCMLYGALNLDEQQFNQVYGLMQKYQQDAEQKGLSFTNAAPENVLALTQMTEQLKTDMAVLLAPDQNRIFTGILPLIHLEPGNTNSSDFNFNFNF